MLTKKDLEKLKEIFATKDDLKAMEDRQDQKFATKEDIVNLKENIISFKDAILKEIGDLRDEVTIIGGSRDMIEDHDIRIEKIEKHLKLSTSS